MQLPVTGMPLLVLVLPPRALETNTCADVAVDVTARSQGPAMFSFVMVWTTVPWSFSTIRHPAGSRPGSAPLLVVGRLPTTTQPPGRMPSAVVRPTPPGQAIPAGSVATSANRLAGPPGDTWTMVVPVPWTLALSLKLLTRMLPVSGRRGRHDGEPVRVHVALGRNGRGDLRPGVKLAEERTRPSLRPASRLRLPGQESSRSLSWMCCCMPWSSDQGPAWRSELRQGAEAPPCSPPWRACALHGPLK